ncbi:hypothetical protein KR450_20060 [Escherichia coli]|uniref:hypothetical protein n=1 Tax=Escherichia coli TaxID=562 RepID=UPI001C392C23|nr:hypothetical protein [Escherichia coli]EHU9797129.1 hypothetical protein [Escherichia coli]MBV2427737.1 hypothetical protein [Escherichia coli]MBV2437459.1 hypothetical protein [Escherichia coli]
MNRSDSPKKQPKPFGVNGQRVAILPTTPAGDNSASYEQGFPPITMILKSAGGLPPKGQDMNQILYELSALGRWSSTGALNTFDSEFASEISGYPSGAMLISNDGERIFINTTEGNLSDPNSNGTGWKDILSYLGLGDASGYVGRLLNIQVFYSSGIYNPTPGTKKVIVEMVGGGGGSAGSRAAGSGQVAVGGAGGAGSYAKGSFTQNFNGVQVTVGTKGAGGTVSGTYASDGGTSSFGSLISAAGGAAGQPAGPTSSFPFSTVAAVVSAEPNGANIIGTPGQGASSSVVVNASVVIESPGGSSQFGAGGFITAFNAKGVNASGYGAGGGPSKVNSGGAAVAGGDGSQGLVIVWEYA